jgi:hypothetical protein
VWERNSYSKDDLAIDMAKKKALRGSIKRSEPPRSLGRANLNRPLPDPESFDRDDLPEYVLQQIEMVSLSQPALPTVQVPENVRLLGMVFPPPGTRSTMVPRDLQQHELLANTCFYSVPLELLKAIDKEVKPLFEGNELWLIDKRLAEICGDHTQQVGFVRGQALQFGLLRQSSPLVVTAEQAKALGWNEFNAAKLELVRKTFDKRSKWYNTIARGYAGWLISNPEFRQERATVLSAGSGVVSITPDLLADASDDDLPVSVRDFLVRWRLSGMAGQRLPIPMRPMLAGQFPLSILSQLMAAGGLFNLPDTYPIPSRDELRSMLEDAIRSEKPAHLQQWTKITSQRNAAKNQIERFARLFEVQHYWELLHERHGEHLQRQTSKLQSVLAAYLKTSEQSIKGDLRFLRSRLGQDWPRHSR